MAMRELGPEVLGSASDASRPDPCVDRWSRAEHPSSRLFRLLCVGTAFCSTVLMFVALVHGIGDGAMSLVGVGIEAAVDILVSLLFLWRYRPQTVRRRLDDPSLSDEQLLYKEVSVEQCTQVCMGFLMMGLSGLFVFKASYKLRFWNHDETTLPFDMDAASISSQIAWPCVGVYTITTGLRLHFGRELGDFQVAQGALVSLFLALMGAIAGYASVFEIKGDWKAEPLAGLVFALVMFVEGFRTIYTHFYEVEDEVEMRLTAGASRL